MSKRRKYDPQADAAGCYAAAIEAKRRRGDAHYPTPAERAPDPETAKQLKRLKRALDRKLKKAEGGNG
ncbi:hypothetical protein [Mesorhizobium silamurunense]|uniref:hypothetical protein n=1 Tax=Mesorhizobium silamurunense TaxID=499528 RepID=UPI001787054C|nr:hypothetical protein [Mesorhizobium silamurunense]